MNTTKELLEKKPLSYKEIKAPDFSSIPGMLSEAEKRYLFWLTSRFYKGRGSVVEVGCWLGSSAAYLGSGMKKSGFSGVFYGFDRFKADKSEVHKAAKKGLSIREGTDTSKIFLENVKDVIPNLKFTKTDARKIKWSGGEIEILHLDAPKKQADIQHVLKIFGPSLIPGESILVLQDFVFPKAYALPLIISSFGEAFSVLDVPDPEKPMVSFKYGKKADFGRTSDIYRWPKQQAILHWKRIENQLESREQKAYFNFGLAQYFFNRGDRDLAKRIAKENRPFLTQKRETSIQVNCRDLLELI